MAIPFNCSMSLYIIMIKDYRINRIMLEQCKNDARIMPEWCQNDARIALERCKNDVHTNDSRTMKYWCKLVWAQKDISCEAF